MNYAKGSVPGELARILAPITEEHFFSEYYEKKPLHVNGRDSFDVYRGFPGFEEFEEILWQQESRLRQSLRVNKQGQYQQIPHHASGKDVFRWAIEKLSEGCTLILNGTDHMSLPVAKVARAIESETLGKVAANTFFTPAGSRGFLPHFDTHDVFVLQVAGQKHWHLFDQRIELPVDRQIHLIDQASVGDASYKFVLEAGDLLYVPRGLVHGAFTEDQHSLHLTMGFRPLRWADYLTSLVAIASENDPWLRQSIRPREFCLEDKPHAEAMSALSRAAKSLKRRREAMDRATEGFFSQLRPVPGGHLKAIEEAETVGIDTLVQKRRHTPCHVYEVGNEVRIQFPGVGLASDEDLHPGAVSAPISAGGALRFIANSAGTFCASDLPTGLSEASRCEIIKKLLREGLLVKVSAGDD